MAGSETQVAGNACLLGQVATFMENLHLSYDEVLWKIPYRNMQVMMRDRLHTVYGEVMQEVTEQEMFGSRIKEVKP